MREKILNFIEKNSRVDLKELAILLGMTEIDVANELEKMEAEGIICGYHTIIDWEKVTEERVNALKGCYRLSGSAFECFKKCFTSR